jgi:hypothetical protein
VIDRFIRGDRSADKPVMQPATSIWTLLLSLVGYLGTWLFAVLLLALTILLVLSAPVASFVGYFAIDARVRRDEPNHSLCRSRGGLSAGERSYALCCITSIGTALTETFFWRLAVWS